MKTRTVHDELGEFVPIDFEDDPDHEEHGEGVPRSCGTRGGSIQESISWVWNMSSCNSDNSTDVASTVAGHQSAKPIILPTLLHVLKHTYLFTYMANRSGR